MYWLDHIHTFSCLLIRVCSNLNTVWSLEINIYWEIWHSAAPFERCQDLEITIMVIKTGTHGQDFRKVHHHHLSLNHEGRWGTTDDFTTNFLHFSLFSTALWNWANSRPVHSLMLSSHLFLCLPCLLPPFTVPCKMVLATYQTWWMGDMTIPLRFVSIHGDQEVWLPAGSWHRLPHW